MEYTDNHKLRLPDGDDYYDVDDFNYNSEKIDSLVQAIIESLGNKALAEHNHTVSDITDIADIKNILPLMTGHSVSANTVTDTEYGEVAELTISLGNNIELKNGYRACVLVSNLELEVPLNVNGLCHKVIANGNTYSCTTNNNLILRNDCVLELVYVNGYFCMSV